MSSNASGSKESTGPISSYECTPTPECPVTSNLTSDSSSSSSESGGPSTDEGAETNLLAGVLDGNFKYAEGMLGDGLDINDEHYVFDSSVLGEGVYGIVLRFRPTIDSSNGFVAVKVLRKKNQGFLYAEHSAMKKVYDILYPDKSRQVLLYSKRFGPEVLVMPELRGVTLRSFLRSERADNAEKLRLCVCLLKKVGVLHSDTKYAHNDLHLGNVIVVDGDVYLIDYGMSHEVGLKHQRNSRYCYGAVHRGSYKILADDVPRVTECNDYFRVIYCIVYAMLVGDLKYDFALKESLQSALKTMRTNSGVSVSHLDLDGIIRCLSDKPVESVPAPEEKRDELVSKPNAFQEFVPARESPHPAVAGFFEVYLGRFGLLFDEELITGQVDFFWPMLENRLAVLMLFYKKVFWGIFRDPEVQKLNRLNRKDVRCAYKGFLRLILLANSESLKLGAFVVLLYNYFNKSDSHNFFRLCLYLNIALNLGVLEEDHRINEKAILCNVPNFQDKAKPFDFKTNKSLQRVLTNSILPVLRDTEGDSVECAGAGKEYKSDLDHKLCREFELAVPGVARSYFSGRFPELRLELEEEGATHP